GGTKFPFWYRTRAGGDTPALDCQAARLHPFDALTHETIDLGGFPSSVVENPALGVEVKINPTRFEVVISRDERDMPPRHAGVGGGMQLKLVSEEALVTVDDPHIPGGYDTFRLLEILQRFGLENSPILVIWRG